MTKNSLLILASQQCKLACPGAASIIFQMQYSDIGGVATCSRPLISDIRYAHAGSQTWNSAGDAVIVNSTHLIHCFNFSCLSIFFRVFIVHACRHVSRESSWTIRSSMETENYIRVSSAYCCKEILNIIYAQSTNISLSNLGFSLNLAYDPLVTLHIKRGTVSPTCRNKTFPCTRNLQTLPSASSNSPVRSNIDFCSPSLTRIRRLIFSF